MTAVLVIGFVAVVAARLYFGVKYAEYLDSLTPAQREALTRHWRKAYY